MPARSEYLGIRLTPQERAALERAAKAAQLSTSALVRLALRELLNGERGRSAHSRHAGRAHQDTAAMSEHNEQVAVFEWAR